MECIYCKGQMEIGKAPFDLSRNGYHIHWDSIKAWVCTQCGEPYFEENEVKLIQKAVLLIEKECATLVPA